MVTNFEDIVPRIKKQIERNMEVQGSETLDVLGVLAYAKLLDYTLFEIKVLVSRMVEDYYDQPRAGRALALDLKDGELGEALMVIFKAVFQNLEDSSKYYGGEYRVIDGVPLEEVEGINISLLGVNVIMPKTIDDLPVKGPVVSLGQIDKLRLQEIEKVGVMSKGDPFKKEMIENFTHDFGGLHVYPLFPDQLPNR